MFDEVVNSNNKQTEIVSLGNWRLTGILLKEWGIKSASYPFDWMVSCMENITHVIKDDFKEFLNVKNYVAGRSNDVKNIFYFDKTVSKFNWGPVKMPTDHIHHNLLKDEDYEYLKRCVARFNNLSMVYNKIVFVMIQPLYLSTAIPTKDEYIDLYNVLLSKFGDKIKLLVFNISSRNNTIFKEDIINKNLILYELDSNIHRKLTDRYDDKGSKKFLELVIQHSN